MRWKPLSGDTAFATLSVSAHSCDSVCPVRAANPYDKTRINISHSSIAFIFKVTVLFALLADTAVAGGDAVRGARDFRSCMACHSINPGEHSTGPSLANLWNRKAGTAEGFSRYSPVLSDANVEWDENSLDQWLSGPRKFIPGTSMNLQGITDAQERADLIAYLKAVSENVAPDIPPQGGMIEVRRRPGK
jgi:cytochrome c